MNQFFKSAAVSALCFILVGCKPQIASQEESQPKSEHTDPRPAPHRPLLFAHYYTWYATGNGPHKNWANQWGKPGDPSPIFPNGTNPDIFLFAPTIRQISSASYPLIGPYDSDNEATIRWHLKLAKATGLDAFAVDWWGPGTWQPVSRLTERSAEIMFRIAEEEKVSLFLVDETFQFHKDLDEVITWAVDYLNRFSKSPSYLRIDGKPVYLLYLIPHALTRTPEDLTRLKDAVEAKCGPIYWMVSAETTENDKLIIAKNWFDLDWVDCWAMYSTFALFRNYDPASLIPQYENVINQVHSKNKKFMAAIHPGHDNSHFRMNPWVMPRDDGKTLKGYLAAMEATQPDFVVVTSFNEWPETTVVEPALNWPDPYLYLKILADWKGHMFVAPEFPIGVKPLLEVYHTK